MRFLAILIFVVLLGMPTVAVAQGWFLLGIIVGNELGKSPNSGTENRPVVGEVLYRSESEIARVKNPLGVRISSHGASFARDGFTNLNGLSLDEIFRKSIGAPGDNCTILEIRFISGPVTESEKGTFWFLFTTKENISPPPK